MRGRGGGAGRGWPGTPSLTPSPCRGPRGPHVQRKSPAAAAPAAPARTPAARALARATPRRPREPGEPRAGGGGAGLPPALAAGAGARAGPGPQLRRAGAFPLLQRLVPPRALPARPQPGQSAGRRGAAAAAGLPARQPAVLPPHALRGGLLHGREQHLEDRGPPVGHCLRLPGLRPRSRAWRTAPSPAAPRTRGPPAGEPKGGPGAAAGRVMALSPREMEGRLTCRPRSSPCQSQLCRHQTPPLRRTQDPLLTDSGTDSATDPGLLLRRTQHCRRSQASAQALGAGNRRRHTAVALPTGPVRTRGSWTPIYYS